MADTTRVGVSNELGRLADELRYQRDLMRTVTDNMAIALFMMDKDGHPLFMNPAACAMTGYAGIDEIRGKPLHHAVHFRRPDGSPYPMAECPIDRANVEGRSLRDQPEVFCRKDGTLFPVRFNVAPLEHDGERLGAVIEVRDVTPELEGEKERARLLVAAQNAGERLDALFMQAPAAIAIVDGPDHVFTLANPPYAELVGRRREDLLGRPVREALPEVVDQGFIPLLDRVRETGEPFHARGHPFVLPDGRTLYLNFVYQPVREPDGTVTAIMAHAVDVTAQVEAQQATRELAEELERRVAARTRELQRANNELRLSNDVLQSFAYVISHDLKEPVRAIENYLTVAAEEYGTEEGRALLERALEANRRQHALIHGLLTYSRTSYAALELAPVALDAVLAAAAKDYFEATARERGARVEVEPLPTVRGNDVLLVQLLGNLILNALRHNPKPAPRVRVYAQAVPPGRVEVVVEDDGPGLPADVKHRLRDLADGRPSTIKGGFGLAISHRAAERLGGKLLAEDAPGGGARIRVLLDGV